MNRGDVNRGAINRRDCLKIAGAAAVLPFAPMTARGQSAPGPCTVDVGLKRLMLRHTWTTTMSSSFWPTPSGSPTIQGFAARFVRFLGGSYSNVVGLPLFETAQLLAGQGYAP